MRDAVGRMGCVVVFGGTSGIGRAVAAVLIADGTRRVVLAGREPERLRATARELTRPGVRITVAAYDAEWPAERVVSAVEEIAADVGDIDVAVVSFGTLPPQAVLDEDTGATQDLLRVIMLAPAVLAHALSRQLARQGHGRLVVLSSASAARPRPSLLAYGAAKSGLDIYARGLGRGLAGAGVGTLVVRPGQVRTVMTAGLPDVPFTVGPERVARTILRQLRHNVGSGPRVVWVPGILRLVMAVLRVMPAPLFRRLDTWTVRDRS